MAKSDCPARAIAACNAAPCPAARDVCTADSESFAQNCDRLPIQPPTKPFVGNLPQMKATGTPATGTQAILEEYDHEVVMMQLGKKNTAYLVSDPEIVQQVLENPDTFMKLTHVAKRGMMFLNRQVVGPALFTASDTEEEWGMAHRVLLQAFSMKGMRPVVGIAADATRNTCALLDRMAPAEPVDIGGLMTGITFDVIGRFAAGIDLGASRDLRAKTTHPFLTAMEFALNSSTRIAGSPMSSKLDLALARDRKKAIRDLHAYVDNVVADRKAERPGARDGEDLLSLMLTKVDPETGKKLSDYLIRQQLITFFVAGHDSTSSLLTTVLYFLTQHPEVEAKMLAEFDSILPGGREPCYEDLKKLTYTTQVLKEALRLNPPASNTNKTAIADTQLGPYLCRKGTKVVISTRALHTNPKVWGPHSDKFDPDNFLPEAFEARHKYAWLPFSAGHRACIGMQLSFTEAKVALAMLVPRYTFRLHESSVVDTDFSHIFAKLKDVNITVHPRKHI